MNTEDQNNSAGTAGDTTNAGTQAAPQGKAAPSAGAEGSASATAALAGAAGNSEITAAKAAVEKGDLYASDKELLAAIDAKTGEKVTAVYMESRIATVAYAKIDATVTVCSVTLDNGFSVRGESACVDPANYDEKIGKSLAYKQAFDKLWPLFGFRLAEARHLAGRK